MSAAIGLRWSEESISRLKKLVADGIPYKLISEKLGITRNAVCGKVMRMGLAESRPKAEPHEAKPRPKIKPVNESRVGPFGPRPEPITPIRDDDIPRDQLKTLIELEESHCRWPIGEPRSPDFRYCGAQRVAGPHPYCPLHMRRSYAPARR